ncbi:DNA polymerase III subunit beta [endosymbiont of Pachyrhynchus infernalis]|uniref:DNA polymerase III subunit beta n=1 Tax=endosymbiont of Pachyrhynchus infernalis TaxID=1971488 RepID=UPI000DC6FA3D|nr:DNA polymerase III subunit beta [endosymbiont of Pachyrhynchus infernalis]BBA84752.1 DNA polymerase III subunit beta [endosymbiont of Pachyrhynchus infernalis]
MKFSILCNTFIKMLKKTNIVFNNNSLQIFKNILILINNKEIKIISMNSLTKIITKDNLIESNINKIIKINISAKKIFDICKKIDKNSILYFNKENNFLILKSNKSIFSISTIINCNILNEFNKHYDNDYKICISCLSLKNLIKKTYYSIGIEDTRKYLNGMLFEIYDNKIKTISTDGHRLSISELKINFEIKNKNKYILTKQGVNELIKYLDNINNNIYIKFDNKNIYIKSENSLFISRLLNENFPEYNDIISKELKYSIKLNKNVLIEVILRISSISNDKFCLIRLNFNNNKLNISSFNSDQEKSEEYIDIDYLFDDDILILLNSTYLIESLSSIDEEFILFKFINNKSCICIEEFSNINNKHIIMPIYSL